jgi:phosphoserine phosphatase
MTDDSVLAAWRPGATRDALVDFLVACDAWEIEDRVATFDIDGTLWCEKPTIVQYDFYADALATAAEANPALRDRPEYAAVLGNDLHAIAELGLERVAFAVLDLFRGADPADFVVASRRFFGAARHRVHPRPLSEMVYGPMLELIDALRRQQFSVFLVTGGGTEFVRAIAGELFGVAPEGVVGTQIGYEFGRNAAGQPHLVRTAGLDGPPNEGEAKVVRMQTVLGRRPVFAAGNSGGDREMLEWAAARSPADAGPRLALLVDHDDAEREYAYVSSAATFAEAEPITAVAARLGWTVASIQRDWETVFGS